MFFYALMIPAGLFGIGWGFWAAHNARKPVDIIGSFVIILGLAVSLVGTLLVCVPGFFTSVPGQ